MRLLRLSFFSLIFFSITSFAFAWQIIPCQQDKTLFTAQEGNIVFNLVFTPLNYGEQDRFQQDVSSMVAALKRISPFDEFKGLTVYLLELSAKEKTILFKQAEDFPYLKVSKNLLGQLKMQLDAPYKLIILNEKEGVAAAELSEINKISLIILSKNSYNDRERLVRAFLHEIGHSLGLREENPHSAHRLIPGPPNCAPDKESAVEWWGDMIGKIEGVNYMGMRSGKNKFIKPTWRSIMNNPFKSDTYGPVNERYLRSELGLK